MEIRVTGEVPTILGTQGTLMKLLDLSLQTKNTSLTILHAQNVGKITYSWPVVANFPH